MAINELRVHTPHPTPHTCVIWQQSAEPHFYYSESAMGNCKLLNKGFAECLQSIPYVHYLIQLKISAFKARQLPQTLYIIIVFSYYNQSLHIIHDHNLGFSTTSIIKQKAVENFL